jgi:hypothetical protein
MALSFETKKKAKELADDLKKVFPKSKVLVVPSKKVRGAANVWILANDWNTVSGFIVYPEGEKIVVNALTDHTEFEGDKVVKRALQYVKTTYSMRRGLA